MHAALLLSSTAAWAQTSETSDSNVSQALDLQSVLGFSNTFRLGTWTPLTVIVTNHDQNLSGEIEVQVTHGDELEGSVFTTTYRRSLELTRNARKRFRFTVLLDSFSRPLVIRVTTGGREVTRRTVDLRRRFTEGHLIVVLSRDADLDYMNDGGGENLRVVYPHPELLPDKWQGYDGVTAVVLHGHSLEHLSPRQYEALKKWLAEGGRLIVSGGPDYSLLRTLRLAALLPAKPVGLVSLLDGVSVSKAFGRSLTATRPFTVNQVTSTSGSTVYQADDTPLVIQKHQGLGRIFYFTFDIAAYPFDRWSGMTQLWLKTFNLPGQDRVGLDLEQTRPSPIPRMLDGPARGFPSHVTVLAFLVVYLGIIALAYQRRGETERGGRSRTLIPWLAPVLFAPGAYFLFGPLLYPLGTTAVTVWAVEPFPRGAYARLNLDVGIYSNQHRRVQWEYEGLDPVLIPTIRVRDEVRIATDWSIREDRNPSVMAHNSKPYVLHLITGEDIIQYELHASARQTEAGLFLNVDNNTGHELAVAGLIFDNTVYAVPTIAAESNRQDTLALRRTLFSLDNPDWPRTVSDIGQLSRHARSTAAFAIEKQVNRYLDKSLLGRNEALLIAVSSNRIVKSRFDALIAHHNVGLVLVRVPVTRSQPGSRTQGRIRDDPG